MEIKIGSVACMREELAGKITGLPENNKFLITALTDYSVTIRSLADNKTHSLRVDSFVNNIKWWEDLRQPDAEFISSKNSKPSQQASTESPQVTPKEPPQEPPRESELPTTEEGFVIKYTSNGKTRVTRKPASYSFQASSVYDDPYGSDPFGGIYG